MTMTFKEDPRIVVVGLGYVGLPLAIALADHFHVVGLDVDVDRIRDLRNGYDRTREVDSSRLRESGLVYSCEQEDAQGADIYIVTVPTPVTKDNSPDLRPVLAATRSVAKLLDGERKTIIVYESTVYPGVTEEICGPELEALSGFRRGEHFWLGYSPERINPGDRQHTVDRIVKVVAGENERVTDQLAHVYGKVTSAGVFKAASIKVAEAAKVIENAQRDINIAFMNEIACIFELIGVSVWDVLEAAGTKWNFLKFQPGLVGGHCIGVDPYYLSYLAQSLGHEPEVILAGRRINDEMGDWLAERINEKRQSEVGRVLVLGVTFKENVPDIRNSKVVDVVRGLQRRGYDVVIHDPLADSSETEREHGLVLAPNALEGSYDVVLCAVPHDDYRELTDAVIGGLVAENGLLADLKGIWSERDLPGISNRWSL